MRVFLRRLAVTPIDAVLPKPNQQTKVQIL